MVDHGNLAKTVRITVPVSVAGNLDKFQGAVRDALGKLGCQACCSGHDILINLERDFFFDAERLAAVPFAATASSARPVTLALSPEAGADIKNVFEGIRHLADRLGCRACCSGHDLLLRNRLDLVVDEAGTLREPGFGH